MTTAKISMTEDIGLNCLKMIASAVKLGDCRHRNVALKNNPNQVNEEDLIDEINAIRADGYSVVLDLRKNQFKKFSNRLKSILLEMIEDEVLFLDFSEEYNLLDLLTLYFISLEIVIRRIILSPIFLFMRRKYFIDFSVLLGDINLNC
ncbi:hypothetical protein IKU74_04405 [bacterium]|nr:hypothetical protein [bacterium]